MLANQWLRERTDAWLNICYIPQGHHPPTDTLALRYHRQFSSAMTSLCYLEGVDDAWKAQARHRFILGETGFYNLLLPDHSPAASKTFWFYNLLLPDHSPAPSKTFWFYNLLLPDHSPAPSKTFRGAGLSSSASKSVKRSGYALKRCPHLGFYNRSGSAWHLI